MARAVSVAGDPYRRDESKEKLRDLIAEIHGVTEWHIDSNGCVTMDYKPEETSSNVVEEALVGIGYRIEHVSDSLSVCVTLAPHAVRCSAGGFADILSPVSFAHASGANIIKERRAVRLRKGLRWTVLTNSQNVVFTLLQRSQRSSDTLVRQGFAKSQRQLFPGSAKSPNDNTA